VGVSAPSLDEARAAFAHFAADGTLVSLAPHTSGLIHHAWQASVDASGSLRRYLLQQINRRVFRRPADVLENMQRIARHLTDRLALEGASDAQRRVISPVPTRAGALRHEDERGESWRLLRWIEGSRSVERATTEAEARATARAFGLFARRLQDLPPPALHATIPGFHDTAARVAQLERVIVEDRVRRASACRDEIAAALDRRSLATALAGPAATGAIAARPVHNDAKIANVLFDAESGEALAVVDLDTTMPGLCAHDFGDLVRSSVSDSEEDERNLSRVGVRAPFFAALCDGFLAGIGNAITPLERSQLVTGARVIVFEQAVRFLADHLDGDRYYRVARPGHNLDRARAQLKLLTSLEGASPELERIVAATSATAEGRS
jgi:aminoglycoside phosphotransferase (APT) family kinase protein